MDPSHPNTAHFLRVMGELWAEYVRHHNLAACEELNGRAERSRAERQRLFGRPRATGGQER